MGTVYDKIKADWLTARKNRESHKATTLGTLVGIIQTKEKTFNPARPLSDAEVIAEVGKILAGVREVIDALLKRGSDASSAEVEEKILSSYMPSMLDDKRLAEIISEKKAAGKDLKTIMTELKVEHAGAYDGRRAAELVKG